MKSISYRVIYIPCKWYHLPSTSHPIHKTIDKVASDSCIPSLYNKKSVCLDTIGLSRYVYLQMQVVVHRSTAQRSRQQSQCHSKCLYISQEMLPRWGDVPMYICISNYIISQSLLILTRVKRAMVINLASKSLKCSCDVSE